MPCSLSLQFVEIMFLTLSSLAAWNPNGALLLHPNVSFTTPQDSKLWLLVFL